MNTLVHQIKQYSSKNLSNICTTTNFYKKTKNYYVGHWICSQHALCEHLQKIHLKQLSSNL